VENGGQNNANVAPCTEPQLFFDSRKGGFCHMISPCGIWCRMLWGHYSTLERDCKG
jgi:hypothetical protein